MSEPTAFADRVLTVAPGVTSWHVHDDRIRFRSDAYAVPTPAGWVLIDPLPLAEAAMASIGRVSAICLTAGQHQRSAWRFRRSFGAQVHAPEGARDLEEAPDEWYADGAVLPGALRALVTPGCGHGHHALVLEAAHAGRVVFCGDLLLRGERGAVELIPDEHAADTEAVRRSVAKLIELGPDLVCPAHGGAFGDGAADTLREVLRGADRRRLS